METCSPVETRESHSAGSGVEDHSEARPADGWSRPNGRKARPPSCSPCSTRPALFRALSSCTPGLPLKCHRIFELRFSCQIPLMHLSHEKRAAPSGSRAVRKRSRLYAAPAPEPETPAHAPLPSGIVLFRTSPAGCPEIPWAGPLRGCIGPIPRCRCLHRRPERPRPRREGTQGNGRGRSAGPADRWDTRCRW